MLKTVIALGLALSMNVAHAATDVVQYTDAAKYYNQTKTVEGTIAGTFCNDKMCFLNFDKDYKKYLSAVIMASDFGKFSKATGPALQAELEKTYAGKKVQITGLVNEYKSKTDGAGRPQINLTEASHIKVVTK